MPNITHTQQEILSIAARLVVEDGFEYGPAKQQAIRQLGFSARTPLPNNDALESAVQEYIQIFCAETQPQELQHLRQIALKWMQIMHEFTPFLSGAVWHGTATRHSDIYIHLYCDDPKMTEIFLINNNIKYTTSTSAEHHNQEITILTTYQYITEWQQQVLINMTVYDHNDIRGALKPDTKKRPPRGNIEAVKNLLK